MSEVVDRTDAAELADIDREQLAAALDEANIPTLVLVLAHLTGDEKWLRDPYRPRRGPVLDDNGTGSLPEEVQREIRAAALDAILAVDAGVLTERKLSPAEVTRMLGVALIEEIPEEYAEPDLPDRAALPDGLDAARALDGLPLSVDGD